MGKFGDEMNAGIKKIKNFDLNEQVGSPDIAHSIVMDSLPTPHLLVLNSTTSEHHIPDDDPMQLTTEAIHLFLESIHQQKATVIWIVELYLFLISFYCSKDLKEILFCCDHLLLQ